MSFEKIQTRIPTRIKNIVITLKDVPAQFELAEVEQVVDEAGVALKEGEQPKTIKVTKEVEVVKASQTIAYEFQLVDQNGNRIPYAGDKGNLEPHLTAEQNAQFKDLMVSVRASIEAEMLNQETP